jgi:transcription-repair coupling factor (superfamily II helicase)
MWKTQYITTIPEASHQTLASIYSPLTKQTGAILWLHENNQEIKKHADLLKIWQKIFNFPHNILTWPDQEQPELSVLQALHKNQNSIILTSQENLELSVASWQFLQDNALNFSFGDKLDLYQLTQDLHALGLKREEEVWNENTFSLRGSLVSIYQNQSIYRFNVWADKIEEIIKIDPYLKQKPEKINSFSVWPNQITHKEKLSLHLPSTTLLVADINFESELQNFSNAKIIFDPFKNKADFNFVTENLLWQHQTTAEKIKYLQEKNNYQIIWFSKNQALAKDFLKDSQLQPSFVDLEKSAAWPSSFCAHKEKIILVNDNLFFQNNEHELQSKQRQKFTLDFVLGDLVVHRDHGIAKLEKITTLEVEQIKREYFVLKYAQNDTLFVPLDLADKLEKYVSPANPKINRLSKDNLWPQTLRKIKQETFILANQLLNIEATRKLHSTPIIQGDDLLQKIYQEFPYTATPSQQQAIDDVLADLKSEAPS